jgi:hypothetical protein
MTEIGPEVGTPDEQPFDASDETQVNNRRRSSKRREAEQRAFLKKMLAEPAGRNWMWGILEFCNAFDIGYVQGDAYATHLQLGQRNVGLKLIADISDVAPDMFARMLKERGKA